MLLKIAWLNIWRSRTRSLVVFSAIAIGVWALVFLMSFSSGMITGYINNAIGSQISHLQIHHQDFPTDKEVQYYFENADEKADAIKEISGVKAVTIRTISNAMIASSKGGKGVQIKAVIPESEIAVTGLNEKVVEGDFFEGKRKNQILISTRLAEKMKVKIRSKVVLTFQDTEGEITAAAFRVSGLFDTGNNLIDESTAYVQRKDLNRLLEKGNIAHEAALMLNSLEDVDTIQSQLSAKFPELLVRNYKEISPEIELFQSQINMSAIIFTVIIMLALVFGIINTMLMAVLERMRELGMLMAIGMNKVKVFFLIVIETILLGTAGAPIGLLLGYFTVQTLGKTGIDLSAWSAGMKEMGMATIVYPDLESSIYGLFAVSVVITAIIGSLYPAFKAIRLKPVEALRKI